MKKTLKVTVAGKESKRQTANDYKFVVGVVADCKWHHTPNHTIAAGYVFSWHKTEAAAEQKLRSLTNPSKYAHVTSPSCLKVIEVPAQ
jgi:hypothetical protein